MNDSPIKEYGTEEEKILTDMEKEFDIPSGFLTKIIAIENEYLFQLGRRGVKKSIEKLISEFAEV